MSRIGASVPPDVPEPSAIHHASELADEQHGEHADREAVGEHVVDRVVADAERARHDEPDAREARARR